MRKLFRITISTGSISFFLHVDERDTVTAKGAGEIFTLGTENTMPHTRVVYVTSMPIDSAIIDYYIHLLPGITSYHAMQRLTLLSCFDASNKPLTEKILERPRLLERIRKSIPADHLSHIACFNVTPAERTLAVQLNVPIYGCDPDLLYLGTKSMGRKIFEAANVAI